MVVQDVVKIICSNLAPPICELCRRYFEFLGLEYGSDFVIVPDYEPDEATERLVAVDIRQLLIVGAPYVGTENILSLVGKLRSKNKQLVVVSFSVLLSSGPFDRVIDPNERGLAYLTLALKDFRSGKLIRRADS